MVGFLLGFQACISFLCHLWFRSLPDRTSSCISVRTLKGPGWTLSGKILRIRSQAYRVPAFLGRPTDMSCECRRGLYKPHEIRWDSIAAEATGKQFVMPVLDKEGRQIVIMRPR